MHRGVTTTYPPVFQVPRICARPETVDITGFFALSFLEQHFRIFGRVPRICVDIGAKMWQNERRTTSAKRLPAQNSRVRPSKVPTQVIVLDFIRDVKVNGY